jgi:tetratricopeptide (TPR) repeat protein
LANSLHKLISIFAITCIAISGYTQNNDENPVPLTREDEKYNILMDAKKQSILGQTENARQLYLDAIEIDSTCDVCFFEISKLYDKDGKYKQAMIYSQIAHSMDSLNSWYTLQYARHCFYDGQYDKVKRLYRKVLRSHGNKEDVWLGLASAYEEQQEYAQALNILDSMEMRFGENDEINYKRHNIYLYTGDAVKAAEQGKLLVDNNPGDPRFHTLLADVYANSGKDALAVQEYDKAIELDRNFPPAILGRAELYRKTGDFRKYFHALQGYLANNRINAASKAEYLGLIMQIPSFAQYFKADMDTVFAITSTVYPSSKELKYLQAMYFSQTERAPQAVSLMKRLTEMDEKDRDVWDGMLSLEYSMGMWNELEKSTVQALELFPQNANYYMYRALALWRQKNTKEAIKVLETLLKKAADTLYIGQAYVLLGDMYHELNKDRKAFSYYEKSFEFEPDNATALNNYAYYLSLKGKNLDKAYAMSKKSLEIEAGNPSFLDTFGYILYLQGKYAEAKTILRQAMTAGGNNNATILEHYADILNKLGERSTAEIWWTKALEKPDCTNPDEIRKKLSKK